MPESIQLVQWIVEAAGERKALDIVTLDLREVTLVADYFVICGGRSTVQTKAIAEHIEKSLEERGVRVLHREGMQHGQWILLDYGAIVVHVLREEERIFYSLERLWGDAKLVEEYPSETSSRKFDLKDKGLTFANR